MHLWYEHVVESVGHGVNGVLREGPLELVIVMAEKRLMYETDQTKVMILERHSKLLGRSTLRSIDIMSTHESEIRLIINGALS